MNSQDASFDVAVIGLGAMGAATLYQLARRGVKAIGLDRYQPPHDQGSSHGESRVTRQSVGEGDAYVPLVLRSHEIWRELERQTGRTLLVDCGMLLLARTSGSTSIHGQGDFLGRTASMAKSHRIAHEVLDAAALEQRFPYFTGLEDTAGYYEPGGGYVVPEACVDVQLTLARQLGAVIKTGAEVTEIRPERDHVVITTDQATLKVAQVVVAAGGWTAGLLGRPFDRLLRLERQIFHWFDVERADLRDAAQPVFIWLHGSNVADQFYGFPPLPGQRQIKLATEVSEVSATVADIDRSVSAKEGADFFRAHVAPHIRHAAPKPARSAVCFYTTTPDHGFIIDRHPHSERIMVVSACSGHGFKHSAGVGEAVAAHVSEGHSPIDLNPFALARFDLKL